MQVGVGIFVDNSEGAFLQGGGSACAVLPGAGGAAGCAMDPAAASASAAALLHAAPVAHVDAKASSKVRDRDGEKRKLSRPSIASSPPSCSPCTPHHVQTS
jgi:hypothetical protein